MVGGKNMSFAVRIVLNEMGRKKIASSIQFNAENLSDISEAKVGYGILTEYIQSIEIIESSKWNGWKYPDKILPKW